MKLSILALLPGIAGVALFGQTATAKGLFTGQAETLKGAKSLVVVFTARQASAPAVEYKLSYNKPDMLRIDSPGGFVVTDGKTIWEYNKADNSYTEAPGGTDALLARVQQDDVYAWSAFFVADPAKAVRSLNTGAKRNIKGNAVTEITFAIGESGKKTATMFVDDKLKVARGMTVKNETDSGPVELLVLATDIKLGAETLPAGDFTFTAPSGAKKAEKPKEAPATWAMVSTIFRQNCVGCHGSSNPKGGVDYSSYQATMSTGSVVAGNPDGSTAIQYVRGTRRPRMPRNAPPLPASEIDTIARWIKDGAKEN